MSPIIETVDLSKTYEGQVPVYALRSCNLTVHRGDFVAVTGTSGSGKTTLLSLLGLLEEPTSGRYFLDGQDVTHLSDTERTAIRSKQLGFVFQAFHLLEQRSVLDNVELGMIYQGQTERPRRRREAAAAIERVGLGHRLHARCRLLSGGERQRVAIARAAAQNPSFILCDEPTGNLDTVTTNSVIDYLAELNNTGTTIIMITHDLRVAQRAHSQLVMSDGRLTKAVSA